MSLSLLFLIAAVVALCIWIVKEREKLDCWLCRNLPWRLRLWWHSLWIRDDPEHPSLMYDDDALTKKIWWARFHLGFLLRCETLPNGNEPHEQRTARLAKLRKLSDDLRATYQLDLAHRKEIASSRKTETPST
jgi:hypothetical protein